MVGYSVIVEVKVAKVNIRTSRHAQIPSQPMHKKYKNIKGR